MLQVRKSHSGIQEEVLSFEILTSSSTLKKSKMIGSIGTSLLSDYIVASGS